MSKVEGLKCQKKVVNENTERELQRFRIAKLALGKGQWFSESHFLVLLPAFETDYILCCSVVLLLCSSKVLLPPFKAYCCAMH